ncbi:MAG: DUF1343 domain-containing protein [Sinobacteraceae bacterium]|nr:DUF1343 domain-containing protein [Nevskiaceae bacterium]
MRRWIALLALALSPLASAAALVDEAMMARVDPLIESAIAAKQIPGAVLLVGRGSSVVYRKAYGQRAVEPLAEPMTVDTLFDLASLTKPIATATAIMQLVEEGRLRLDDRVASYLPDFGRHGKDQITVRQLLTHVGGLRGDLDLDDPWVGRDTALELAAEEIPLAAPGERFIYSDIGFLVLGALVEQVSGLPLDQFVRQRITTPLGMQDTGFKPPASAQARIAPTQRCTPLGPRCEGSGQILLRGEVHDPTARRMRGVAGHAGLFGTADDLARYARMLLGGGALGSTRILSPLSVIKMTSPATPVDLSSVRGLGWDIDSSYSSNRGELLPIGSFGHTGFTGTSIWIDPLTETYVILLTHRVHPDGRGDVSALRAQVATLVGAALRRLPDDARLREARWSGGEFQRAPARGVRSAIESTAALTLSGIDVLRSENYKPLIGKRVGLLTHQAAIARSGESTIDLLAKAKGLTLVALFSPEHGLRSDIDAAVPSGVDPRSNLPVYSLYGETRRPNAAMLRGIDTLVIDLQDVGARFYTYATTVAYVLEEAARSNLEVIVLDRPNPLGGTVIEGPSLERSELSFTAYFPMPIRHGLTLGELARLFNAEGRIGAKLSVISVRYWQRDAWFDETGLPWVAPSPNLRSLQSALLYPGVATIEGANISVGRGTDTPFQLIGAPWIDGVRLAAELNAREIPGVRFYPVTFTPTASQHQGERCGGVSIVLMDRERLPVVRLGLELASALDHLYGPRFELDRIAGLFGRDVVNRLRNGESPQRIVDSWRVQEAAFRRLRAPHLLYR